MAYLDDVDCCTDENECAMSRGQVCPQNSRCENTHGSFSCICNPGFQLNTAMTTCEGQYSLNQLYFPARQHQPKLPYVCGYAFKLSDLTALTTSSSSSLSFIYKSIHNMCQDCNNDMQTEQARS